MPLLFWMCLAAFLPYLLFVIAYMTRSPWYASPVGRSLMLSKVVIVALLGHPLALFLCGPYQGAEGVWVVLFGLTCVAGTTQLLTLLRLQRNTDGAPRRRSTDRI